MVRRLAVQRSHTVDFLGHFASLSGWGDILQPVWISWSPGALGLAMGRNLGEVTRGLYISGLLIAVIKIHPYGENNDCVGDPFRIQQRRAGRR